MNNGNVQWFIGAILGILMLVLGGISTLILWNITQLATKVDKLEVIVYDTKSGLETTRARQEEAGRQIAEIKGTLETALGKARR